MKSLRSAAIVAVGFACGMALASSRAAAAERELNRWPLRVDQLNPSGQVSSWQAAGPFYFEKPGADGMAVSGVRPLYTTWRAADGSLREFSILYPVFTYRTDGDYYRWSLLQLINRSGHKTSAAVLAPTVTHETFDVWPFWFSRDTGSAESSYRALFPVYGTIKNRFGQDRLSWVIFPLYARAEKNEAITTASPWPFIKVTRGTETGFAFWPVFGWRTKPNAFDRRFYLWPLGWNNTIQSPPDAPPGTAPRREVGFLPFYSRETSPGYVNESFVWPFFGYTDRTQPVRYHETRYFWPFWVKGRGDDRSVDRYAPFYTRSIKNNTEKVWAMWPVYRQKRFAEAGIQHTQRQVLYFLYWSLEQRSTTNPSAAPAEKSHLWPVYSNWDNGAGRRQFQFPSPLEIFFPDNERVRQSWSPLFSLYRYDQRAPDTVRHEALWGLISWRREPAHREFHFGPLFSTNTESEQKRIAIGNGLLGLKRSAGSGWRLFWFDFPAKAPKVRASRR